MWRRLLVLLAAAACMALAGVPGPAARTVAAAACVGGETESKGDSAVDDGEIRWTDTTAYDDARKFRDLDVAVLRIEDQNRR